MNICLVSMPWQSLELPSLPLALLKARLAATRPQDAVAEYHGYLRWSAFLMKEDRGAVAPAECNSIADEGVFHGLGDWVFSGALYGDPQWRLKELEDYSERHGIDIETIRLARSCADEFIELAIDEILAEKPQVVGFSTTFMQNSASLAAARRLKERAPWIKIVFGGGNCDGSMGHALHRNHPFIDYVVRGEGEVAFPELLARIERGAGVEDIPGVCWWNGTESVANPQPRQSVPPEAIPRPDFDAWQHAFTANGISAYIAPKLAFEGSRGCWWGEKHHCTFCGLNGSAIEFRSRPADRLLAEIEYLVRRYGILDLVMVDNIIDMAYFRDLLPRLAESEWDLRIHYEVKANLRPEQVKLLFDAGVLYVQPGIESLSRRVLDLMDKGTTGVVNLRALRECEGQGLTVSWNYLFGFPGEGPEDYEPIIDQIPALVHLQPPGSVSRLILERFSPYFDRPELGFEERWSAEMYRHVYDLPEEELRDLVYFFESPPQGIGGRTVERLHRAVAAWRRGHADSRLVVVESAEDLLAVEDHRVGWPRTRHVMTGWRAAAYRVLERGHTVPSLVRALAAMGHERRAASVRSWLDELVACGLVFVDDHRYVALATNGAPRKLGSHMPEVGRWRAHAPTSR